MSRKTIEHIFLHTIESATGFAAGSEPAGTVRIDDTDHRFPAPSLYRFFRAILSGKSGTYTGREQTLQRKLRDFYEAASRCFIDFYSTKPGILSLNRQYRHMLKSSSIEEKATYITHIWAPELGEPDSSILNRWQLRDVSPAEHPISPEEVFVQLNALYTVPAGIPDMSFLDDDTARELLRTDSDFGTRVADYDHPVPLFCSDTEHELIFCLKELDTDIAFEKEKKTFRGDFQLLVAVSISTTHEHLDRLAELWVRTCIMRSGLEHLSVLLLSEELCASLKGELLGQDFDIFTVHGKYANHFNALKYLGLLLERAYGYRAGFKLDTDEGIRTEELLRTRGKTWFQTLCHEYWGGRATNWRGEQVSLGVNVGEYMNNRDIERHGYSRALRTPDVPLPDSYCSTDIFFNKGFAHGRATALYNQFDLLEDCISHPVVKGGGYGIRNDSLREFVPFALSTVGRAEDQQFYFHGLSLGLFGIFHPDLRIAHYKERVTSTEGATEITRFIGDMYRLLTFEHLAHMLGVKECIDPMPGIFAGHLAVCQTLFNTLYRAYVLCTQNRHDDASHLLQGLEHLSQLQREIAAGTIRRKFDEEASQWKEFVKASDKADRRKARELFNSHIVR